MACDQYCREELSQNLKRQEQRYEYAFYPANLPFNTPPPKMLKKPQQRGGLRGIWQNSVALATVQLIVSGITT